MSFSIRVLAVGAATLSFVFLVATAVVPRLIRLVSRSTPGRNARHLTILRLIPAGAALAAGALVVVSFLNFEPRGDENIGWMVPVLGGIGAMLMSASLWRAARVALTTRRLAREWLATGEPVVLPGISAPALAIPSRFPVVAVVGIARPRLVIARSVLQTCTSEELGAVLAHEKGHIERRDNLRRLLMYAAPDAVTWIPGSAGLAAAWRSAIEEAADDEAAAGGEAGRLALASALIKIARLASGLPPQRVPVSTFHCGDSIEARVRRLLRPRDVSAGADVADGYQPFRMALAITSVVAVSMLALSAVQELVEIAVHSLP
ncbi:MAG TPA: M56 family metallopeptidase [Vicinamibacterales bacterium]|nr:M56 family metallopeptidase [Vicinamibacterales bacterium]